MTSYESVQKNLNIRKINKMNHFSSVLWDGGISNIEKNYSCLYNDNVNQMHMYATYISSD